MTIRSQVANDRPTAEYVNSIERIGDILIVEASASADDVERIVRESERCPWLPVIVEHDGVLRAEIRLAMRLLPLAVQIEARRLCECDRAAAALRQLSVSPLLLYRYLKLRCAHPATAELIYSTLQEEPWVRQSISRSAYYEAFRRLSTTGPAAWKNVLIIAPFAGCGVHLERLAFDLERDIRTIRAVIQQDIGVTPRFFVSTPGWQWVIEIVLRRSRLPLWSPAEVPPSAPGCASARQLA